MYLRHNKELRKINHFVSRRKKKSDFERLFLEQFPLFFKQCEEALKLSQNNHGMPALSLCHGNFHHHNVLFCAGQMMVVHFERAGLGLPIHDFCNFKRKIMEKQNWDVNLGLEMLREYHRLRPLDASAFEEMVVRLSYPEKFWKLANRYYVSNKVLGSKLYQEKLEAEMKRNESRQNYLLALKTVGRERLKV